MIIIVSVPHTGTVLTKHILSKAGLNPLQHHCHSDSVFPLLERRPNADVVVPLRHPEKSWRTWCRRGTGLGQNDRRLTNHDERFEWFVQAWKWLDQICDERNPYYLPIDLDSKDEHLNEMSRAFGVELEHDWTPRNETIQSLVMHEHVEKDLSEVMGLDVVRRFYEA